jgi:hypothetical protein
MHKDLAALIKKHSKSVHTADKKNRDVTKSDLEERAIKLGKKQRGEVCVCNSSNLDTNGTEESDILMIFQGMQELFFGKERCPY